MTSIVTNSSAMSALRTLRLANAGLDETQERISSGFRIGKAADNAAYWSISTTMRSDRKAISAVADALGLGAAKVDTAYAAMSSVVDVLAEFKARLLASKEKGIDKAKIQGDLEQLKQQVVSIAQSASFNGVNWLNTDIADIHDTDLDVASVTSGFVRDAAGNVSVKTSDLHLGEIALFNSTGGGLLEADSRKMLTLGGIRSYDTFMDSDGVIWMDTINRPSGDAADIKFYFNGPLTFDDPSDVISFNITVDADNPADLDPGYNPGKTTGITIDRSLIDAYDPALNGVISNYDQYREIIGYALSFYDADAHAHGYAVWDSALQASVPEVDAIGIRTSETSGLDGSYVGISGFFTNVGSGGLGNGSDWGLRGSQMDLAFSPFTLYKDGEEPDGVEVSFTFGVNGEPPKSYSFNRTFVNELLGKDNGKIETADEMVTLLQTLMADDWPHVTIEATSSSNISITSDKAFDRLAGMKTGIGFTGISVNIEPLSELNFRDIDIVANPNMTDVYLTYMELVHSDVISAAAVLGSLQKRIDMQSDFTRKLMDSVDSGIGRLIDADMEEESSRLVAQQTQQQLATQALYIANRDSSNFLRLFQ